MRLSPTFSDTRLSLSFFLTTPAKKPRTECCCQSVAFMIAAIVVPFGCRNIPSTVSCLDGPLVPLADVGSDETVLGAGLGKVELRLPRDDLLDRGGLVPRPADFDLGLLVAIWLSLMSTAASCAATDASRRRGRARAVGVNQIPVVINAPTCVEVERIASNFLAAFAVFVAQSAPVLAHGRGQIRPAPAKN
jgi:hypothetical protein